MTKKHIVIAGAGFGGMYVARHLLPHAKRGEISITIINPTNYFLFTPLLHEVATGTLSTRSVAEPLSELFVGLPVTIKLGTVSHVDTVKRQVLVDDTAIAYDYLVIATGAETSYYDIPGAREYTLPLKTLADAVKIRTAVIKTFEQHEDRCPTFVVVGGGPTGVELAAELSEFVDEMEHRYYQHQKQEYRCTVSLVTATPDILPMFTPSLRYAAMKHLERIGVQARTNTSVISVTANGLRLGDGTNLASDLTIWTAGVHATIPDAANTFSVERGRIITDRYLHAKGSKNVFVLGDAAQVIQGNATLPMLAQVAVSQARVVAKNVMARVHENELAPFHFHFKGSLVSLGKWYAIGDLRVTTIRGRFAWWLWRTVYLFKFISWKKRFRIAFEWTMDIFAPRDITKL